MNLTISRDLNSDIKKYLFKLKPLRRDGLLLNIHHSKDNKRIRFVHACFHRSGHIIASSDNEGNLYIIDFSDCKFWRLPQLSSCTFLIFSSYNQNELLTGLKHGDIYITDVNYGRLTGKLEGHKYPITNISFNQEENCLTASQYEAIVWNLETNTKLQVLSLEKGSILKYVAYMPVSNNILACFQDDSIQIWNSKAFESVKQFLPVNWKNYAIKSITFSRNGQIMIISGYLPTLAVVLLDRWKLLKFISLPEYIHTVKSIDFVVQSFDGGCNKFLAILSGQGIIYFCNIEENIIVSELTSKCEISKFVICPNGSYIACILTLGEVELYSLTQYIMPPVDIRVEKIKGTSSKLKQRLCVEKIGRIKSEISDVLDKERLKTILKEYGEYPEIHRLRIWDILLQLPNNIELYNSIINHVTTVAFQDLYEKYPLESKITIKNLKMLMNNIVTWCPFFAQVDYLPVFAFPFVKVFQNKPVACFEAVCTVILNWSQHWFEYFPLPPVNILAMIENILMEHDPELLHYFSSNNITANIYIWPLLETAFSEVLTSSEWLIFWDHVLTNEPSFLLCAVAAYSIVQRNIIISLTSLSEFEFFFHNQNPHDIKKFLSKVYHILNTTSEKIHPRQYLEMFNSLERGNYPLFLEYPKTVLNMQVEETNMLKKQDDNLKELHKKWMDVSNDEVLEEENRRLGELEKIYLQRIKSEQKKIKEKHDKLQQLRKLLLEEEEEEKSNRNYQNEIIEDFSAKQSMFTDHLMKNIRLDKTAHISKLKAQHIKQYFELLKYKYRIKEILSKDKFSVVSKSDDKILQKYQQELKKEIDKVKKSLESTDHLKKLNIATSIAIMEKLIKYVETNLQDKFTKKSTLNSDDRVKLLQAETKGLEKEVLKLLKLLDESHAQKESVPAKEDSEDRIARKSKIKSLPVFCQCEDILPKTVRFRKTTFSA